MYIQNRLSLDIVSSAESCLLSTFSRIKLKDDEFEHYPLMANTYCQFSSLKMYLA